jgi:hypothetical protein
MVASPAGFSAQPSRLMGEALSVCESSRIFRELFA